MGRTQGVSARSKKCTYKQEIGEDADGRNGQCESGGGGGDGMDEMS